MTLETLSAMGSESESWGCFEDLPSPIEVSFEVTFANYNVLALTNCRKIQVCIVVGAKIRKKSAI